MRVTQSSGAVELNLRSTPSHARSKDARPTQASARLASSNLDGARFVEPGVACVAHGGEHEHVGTMRASPSTDGGCILDKMDVSSPWIGYLTIADSFPWCQMDLI